MKKIIEHEININIGIEPEIYAEYRGCIAGAANAALNFEQMAHVCEISIEITDNSGIRQLNKDFRGKDKTTDVLSFPMSGAGEPPEINPESGAVMLGDIIISGERAREQSEEIGQGFGRELMFLTVHSVLHLLGYDHELSQGHDSAMRKKQREIMGLLGNWEN